MHGRFVAQQLLDHSDAALRLLTQALELIG
jgi:hypothetical protein